LEGAWRRIGWPGRAIAVVASLAALVYLRIPEAADFIYFRF
jgi:hypothetical protein